MHEVHPDLLWIGNAMDVRDPRALFAADIVAVVDLAYEEPIAKLPRELIYCRFPLLDGEGNNNGTLRIAVQTVIDLLVARMPTMVGCSAGMSRSPTIAAFAMAAHLNEEPTETVTRMSRDRSLEVKSSLWNDVANVFPQVRRDVT